MVAAAGAWARWLPFPDFRRAAGGLPRPDGLALGSRHAWRARRSARAVAPASRGDGGAGQRAGAPGQDRGADRRQYGGGGLFGLRAARGRHARTVRHRRPQPGGRSPDRAALGRRPGRPGRERGQPDQLVGSPDPSGLLVPPGDRRRNLSLVPGRAGPARRQYPRRAGGAEPGAAHLLRGGGRGAADHRDGAGRDDRLGRIVGASPSPAPSPRARRPLHLTGVGARRRHRARPCGAARAARRHHELHRRRRAEGIEAPRRRRSRRCAPISTAARAPRGRRRRRAPGGARSLPHVRPRPRLDAPAATRR